MQYISTRGGMEPASFLQILMLGLASDGGLVVPQFYKRVSPYHLQMWRDLSFQDLAFEVLSLYIDDIPRHDLREIIGRTFTKEIFGSDEITPLQKMSGGYYLLELSNGPTLAFKDVAMQLLGNLFEYALSKTDGTLNIVGATSGDTGSSAEYAMRGKKGIQVFMLSPHKKMSPFQEAQMYSLQEPNIFNIAIKGVFDDCQDIVKAVGGETAFKVQYHIGTVNSINWARVAAQVVYYFKAYFAATKSNDERVSFSVPSGNFGNACAAHNARMLGLPIERIIVATNENDVLDEFFRTGVYRPRTAEKTQQTSSPSMDISKASNFERFIYDLVGRDPARVRALWAQLDKEGFFDLSSEAFFYELRDEYGFVSGKSTHADRIATMRRVWQEDGRMIDTHTADGIYVGLRNNPNQHIPLICMETALAAKFAPVVREALGREPVCPPGYEDVERKPQQVVIMEPDVRQVMDFIAAHC